MSSRVLYPPVLDSYMPAFQAGEKDDSYCRVYFSLSKFNSSIDFRSVHVSVMKQSNGINVVKPTDDSINDVMRYRSTGIILNVKPTPVQGEDNLYYLDIYNADLSSEDKTIGLGYKGWIPGWIYKIQIRLSTVDYDGSIGQATWLNENANNFSEWSTVCIVKAIGKMDLVIPPLDYNSQNKNENYNEDTISSLYLSTLNFFGKIISEDPSEVLYKYSLKIYDSIGTLLEETGELYSNQYQNNNEFKYLVKYEFQDAQEYKLVFNYVTNNGFEFTYTNRFIISLVQISKINCDVLTLENDTHNILKEYTNYQLEEEEGRICLKLFSTDDSLYNGNVCIRRSSSKSNFKEWVDIKIFNVAQQTLNSLPVIYDYTIESGIWYKYGVQPIDGMGNRGILEQTVNPVMRNFEYSYLLGENNQQLKLMFNNTMPNYKIQLMEGKLESIGGTYPIIARNGALKYRIFPINGLISFWMDENYLFCDKKIVYGNQDIVDLYNKYNDDNGIIQYDYIYERDFRQMVLNFLHDGKPKLFKSPTEGNVIVRLTDINCVPNQTTDRMIYEFTSTGNELAEDTYDNYIKYNFLEPGEWSPNIFVSEMHIGQIQMEFTPTTNVFYEIYKKYDGGNRNYGGYRKTLKSVQNIRITIEDPPLRIRNSLSGSNYDIVLGNNIRLNGKLITIYGSQRIYEFDDRLTYTKNDELYLLGDAEGIHQTVNATIDFVYDIQTEEYQEKQRQSVQNVTGIGQIYHEFNPGDSIYDEISYKYFIDWDLEFRELNKLTSIEIESNPGVIFSIKDESDLEPELHEMNETGTLRFYDIDNIKKFNYIGVRDPITGGIDETKPMDILINYTYVLSKGTYKGE